MLKKYIHRSPDPFLPPSTVPPSHRPTGSCAGFTLVEVLLTSLILGIGLTVLLASLSTCLRTMKMAREYERVQWTLGLGELAYPDPVVTSTDVKEDYTVEPDSSLCEGFTFERKVDEKTPEEEQKSKLYVVRTRVLWGEGSGDDRPCEELVRYVWQRDK
ncbi:MAG: type IV pilus modification PilV family protein [Kiritimatiellia bacterium]